MSRQKWSAEIIISAIKQLRERSEPLNSGHAKKHHNTLVVAAANYFGSWGQALEAAGIPYDAVRLITPRSKESITKEIRSLAKKGPINSNYIQIHHGNLYGAACKYFGGWREAVEAAGYNYDRVRKRTLRTWSKAAIVNEIVRRASAGLSIRTKEVSRENSGLYHAAKRHFGRQGWMRARVQAGFVPFDPLPHKKWTSSKVVEEIQRLHTDGIPLNSGQMQKDPGLYRVLRAGRKVFGSWEKAIKSAGLDYSVIRKNHRAGWWNKARVIKGIKSLEKQGARLSSKAIQYSHGDLFGAAVVKFGSWAQAVEAAGISYRMHNTRWSTKAWLRKMRPADYSSTLERTLKHSLTRRRKR